jgi:hypothetical protein
VLVYDVAGTDRGNDLKFTKETSAFDSDARAGLDYLAGHARCTGRLGVIGICLGGHRGQVELTFAPLSWADVKLLDTGTRRVVSGGCRILHDPDALLASVCELVNRLIEPCRSTVR